MFLSLTMRGLVSSLLVASAAAQQTAYGQCGGTNYSGSTTCTAGFTCVSYSAFYSQCVPGTASTTATSASTVKPTSTGASSVDSSHVLELRAGPGSLEKGENKILKARDEVVTNDSTTSSSAAATATGVSSFATTDGLMFKIDGETKYFAGTNCYWCGFLTEDADVDSVFSHMATAGFKVIRVWGFNDVTTKPSSGTVYYQYLSASGSTINTGADGLERMDVVVAAAEKHGLKLIINFVNNWSDYGGIAAYVTAFGGSATSWYTDSTSQTQYQTYIKAVVSRYVSSTAIFAWELANEARCSGCDTYVLLLF